MRLHADLVSIMISRIWIEMYYSTIENVSNEFNKNKKNWNCSKVVNYKISKKKKNITEQEKKEKGRIVDR